MELLRKVSTSFKREEENKDENDEPDLEAALTSLYGIGWYAFKAFQTFLQPCRESWRSFFGICIAILMFHHKKKCIFIIAKLFVYSWQGTALM